MLPLLEMGVLKGVVAVGMQIVVGKVNGMETCKENVVVPDTENGRGISEDPWLEAVLSTNPEVEVEVVADGGMDDC